MCFLFSKKGRFSEKYTCNLQKFWYTCIVANFASGDSNSVRTWLDPPTVTTSLRREMVGNHDIRLH